MERIIGVPRFVMPSSIYYETCDGLGRPDGRPEVIMRNLSCAAAIAAVVVSLFAVPRDVRA